MTPFYDWKPFLTQISKKLLEEADEDEFEYLLSVLKHDRNIENYQQVYETIRATLWLGLPPASEVQIKQAEARLGKIFPPSYRQFLQVANGWRSFNYFPLGLVDLWSTERLEWFVISEPKMRRGRLQNWLENVASGATPNIKVPDEAYFNYEKQNSANLRLDHFKETLHIGESDGNECVLLNPLAMNAEGEWEAWLIDTAGDISRFPSFLAMMDELGQMI